VSGSLRAGVTFPSSSPLEGNPSTHWAFRPVCVLPKRESSETQRTDRTRAGHHRRAFPVLRAWSLASTRCGRTAAREDRSSDSKVDRSRRQEKHHRGKRPGVVISSARAARPKRTRVKNGCRARIHGASPRVSSLQSEGVLGRGDPWLSRDRVRESVLVGCERALENCARAARSRRQAPEAERDGHRGEDNAPRSPPSRIDRSTHGDVNRRPTWLERRKAIGASGTARHVGCPSLRELGTSRSYASPRRLSWMRHARWQHRASPAERRWLLMQTRCTRCMVPAGT
jgi:hypothetical protein